MRGARYRVERLGNHDRTRFSCGQDDLDRYFKRYASQDVKRNISTVRVMVDCPNDDWVIGFYTLSSLSVPTSNFPLNLQKRIPYDVVRGTLLGRLAVDTAYQSLGLGRALLVDALRQAADTGHTVPSAFVVVDAKDDQAKAFYERCGLVSFPSNPLRLYIHMKTIDQALTAKRSASIRSS